MTGFRWRIAALTVFGGLIALALLVFGLFVIFNVVPITGDGAVVYWLMALCGTLGFGSWLLIVTWCYVDAERRSMNAPLWALLVFLAGFPLGPILYLVLRTPAPVNGVRAFDREDGSFYDRLGRE